MRNTLKRIGINTALVLGSSLFSFLLIELAFRLTQPGRPEIREPHVEYVYVPCDESLGRTSDYVYLKPDQSAYHYGAAVSTNSFGIRNREISPENSEEQVRILALGDSHTFGFGVENDQTWPRQLEAMLEDSDLWHPRSVELINGGIEALSLRQEIQFFRDKLAALQPDVVILAYYWNDMPMVGLPSETISPEQRQRETDPCRKLAANGKSDATAEASVMASLKDLAKETVKKSHFIYFVVQRLPFLQMAMSGGKETQWKKAVLEGARTENIDSSWAMVDRDLGELRELSRELNFELILVAVPLFEQMTTDSYPNGAYQSRLAEGCAKFGIPMIDPLAAIRKIEPSYPEDFIPFDGHPNGRIYRVIANEVHAHLKQAVQQRVVSKSETDSQHEDAAASLRSQKNRKPN